MSIQTIGIGNAVNDGLGDPARVAGQKINANFQYLEGLINAAAIVENRYDTAPNNTRAAMIADQSNQSSGKIQYVQDARSAVEISAGDPVYYDYYEYLGTTNGDISDYRSLDDDEISGLQNSFSWKQKRIVDIDLDANVTPADASAGNVVLVYLDTAITHIIFDSGFSKILEKARASFSTTNYALNLLNATENTNLRAIITSFEWVNSNANLKVGVSGIDLVSVTETDVLQFELPETLPDYLKLPVTDYADLYFNTSQNANPMVIEDGNHFYGHPTAATYVVGRVVDATDFDPYDTEKAKLFIDSE
jgi:hypothetical protein